MLCNGNGPCPSRLIAGQRCVRRSARVAAGPWYNDAARLTSNSEIVKRVSGTECPLTQSDMELLQGRTGHRLQHVRIRGMKGTMSKVHCHLYVSWLQPTKDFTGASTMELPGVLGYPSHCELHEPMLCYRVLAKRLIGTLSAIPHLILIYQLNDQPK